MAIEQMVTLLDGIDKHPFMGEVDKCLQIRAWRRDFVIDMNTAISLAEINSDKAGGIVNSSGITKIHIPNEQEIKLKAFFKEGLELIDSYLKHYIVKKDGK